MSLTKVTYSMISGAAHNVLDFGADPTGVADSTTAINAALVLRGAVYIPPGTYKTTSALTIYGDTELFGAGPGVSIIKGSGFTSGNLLQDSSQVTTTDVNLNIILRDFEIDCNSYAVGTSSGVVFTRVGNLLIDNIYVHDCGGTTLKWGQSYTDSVNIHVRNSRFVRARDGDGTQGFGRNVFISNCYVESSGDTCYATVADWYYNPLSLPPSNINYSNCVAKGDWVNGVFTGTGRQAQLGFAYGPYTNSSDEYITISGCTCENLFANVWIVVLNKVKLIGNTFKPHANTLSGGVRLDGIKTSVITGNIFENSLTATGTDFQSLLFVAGSFVYGASTFYADTKYVTITGNIFQNNTNPAIQFNVDPTTSVVSDVVIADNVFVGTTEPVRFSPTTSSGTEIFDRIKLSGNSVSSTATFFVSALGAATQYSNFQISDNNLGTVPIVSGTGLDAAYVANAYKKIVATVPDAVATTIYTLNANYHTVEITAMVFAGSSAFTAIGLFVNNGGFARIAWQSNGANCVLTLVGLDVKVTQSGVGVQPVTVIVRQTA